LIKKRQENDGGRKNLGVSRQQKKEGKGATRQRDYLTVIGIPPWHVRIIKCRPYMKGRKEKNKPGEVGSWKTEGKTPKIRLLNLIYLRSHRPEKYCSVKR